MTNEQLYKYVGSSFQDETIIKSSQEPADKIAQNNTTIKMWDYINKLTTEELKNTLAKAIIQNNQLKSDFDKLTIEHNDFRRQHIGDGRWDRY